MKVLTIVNSDDWTGFYVDNDLAMQNHSIDSDEILSYLSENKIGHFDFEYKEADEDWLYSKGYLPNLLTQVKFKE
jgi:hypothetical protein